MRMNNLIGFSSEPKTDILLKTYKTYKLYGRIKVKNVKKYEETHDKKYILYRFCINERAEEIPDYRELIEKMRMKERKEFLAKRIAQGYKSL